MAESPLLELKNVSKTFEGSYAVHDVSLGVEAGKVLCLLGENGAGKSTTVRVLTGVEQPTSGAVLMNGEEVRFRSVRDSRKLGISAVFQEAGSVPLMSVARNFILGSEITKGRGPLRRLDLTKASEIALEMLHGLGIRGITSGNQPVGTLSGGERQALAIGRAVHFGARVLILDEPTAALGVRESGIVLRIIKEVRDQGVGVVFITHNVHHACDAGDKFVVLSRGEVSADFAAGELEAVQIIELMQGASF